MSKRTRIIVLALAFVMIIASVFGATYAYLTDTDSAENVMVLGNVNIEQTECQRVVDENGDFVKNSETSYLLEEFKQAKPAYPAVYQNGKVEWDSFYQPWDQVGAPGSNDVFNPSVKNVVDKFVFVENTGKTDAYYRTIIAVEIPEGVDSSLIHVNLNGNSRFDYNDDVAGSQKGKDSDGFYTTVNGVRYFVYTATYTEVLTPGEVSRPSLLQVFLDPLATNEDCAAFGDTWDVLTFTQAVQVAGFESADAALDAAFGDISADNHPWIDGVVIPTVVSDKDSVKEAFANGESAVLTESLAASTGELKLPQGATLNGNNETIVASGSSTKPALVTTGGTIKNVTFNGKSTSTQGIGAGMTTANPLVEDLYIDDVTVDNVMYAVIGTANDGVNVNVNKSTLYGAFSYVGASVKAYDSVFGEGNSMMGFFEVSADTSFTNCTFEGDYSFLAYDFAAGSKLEFSNCNAEGVEITAENFKSLMVSDRWDGNDPTLSSEFLADVTIIVNGVTVQW